MGKAQEGSAFKFVEGQRRPVVPRRLARSVTSYAQVDGSRRKPLSHSVDQGRKNGRSKSSEEISQNFESR
jgi:hypothetical protein